MFKLYSCKIIERKNVVFSLDGREGKGGQGMCPVKVELYFFYTFLKTLFLHSFFLSQINAHEKFVNYFLKPCCFKGGLPIIELHALVPENIKNRKIKF